MTPDKKRRYARNKKIRAYYTPTRGWLDLEIMTEDEKDTLYNSIPVNSLDNLEIAEAAFQIAKQRTIKCIPIDEENTMNTTTTSFETERRALLIEVDRFECEIEDTIRHHFAIDPYKAKTPKEFVALIKEDKFDYGEFEKQADDPDYFVSNWISPLNAIRLMPKEVNKTGYSKAREELRAAIRDTKLEIKVLDPEKGLEKVKSLKKRTFH